ncbi:protein HGH1 homolog [Anthonomus grandis grandis]|uniref:protein HGH1 homolog n=1 Tax=Anthonomus grandis grandis TaxID=2921223 RepID=UPI002166069C|nr:protein HGH1 homolog [Anthonomus grandis grandis]XP_050315702.1 protein HGH1 homolog [Anthonomus grandis grandis]
MEKALEELLKYVQIGARIDLKAVAVEHVLGLTGTPEGVEAVYNNRKLLVSLISLLDDQTIPISKDSSLCLINISANEKGAQALLEVDTNADCPPLQLPPENVVNQCLKHIFNKESKIADQCCMILSNLTRPKHLIERVVNIIEKSGKTFDELVDIFTKKEYNKGAKLHYLGPVLSNLSQSSTVRRYILDRDKCVIQRLLPFTEYKDSLVRRGGIVGTLKNCCFETDFHEWLLSEDVDILPRLLLPLAGSEEFDEEDNDKLPLELQYLPEDKIREEDPDIRCILLEAITQLCSKKVNREFVRDKNTYVILRELHKWEKDKKALLACENLVDILIRTEEEIAEDNLKDLDIPEHLIENFSKMNKELLEEEDTK